MISRVFWILFAFTLFLSGCVLDPGLPAAPSLKVSCPAPGGTVYGPVLTVAGTASDGYGLEGVYADLDSAGYSRVTGMGSWSTNYRNVANGSHTLKVFSKAVSGLTSQTDTINIMVTNGNSTNTNQWTVMIYLDGDNNLELFALWDFDEMERGILSAINAGSGDLMTNLSVIVLFDRVSSWPDFETEPGGGDWWNTRLYRVLPDPDTTYFASERLDDGLTSVAHHIPNLGSMNMGGTNTLKFLIGYSMTNYPAKNYALILWDHGAGVQYMCVDDTSGDRLYIDEIRQSVGAYLTNTNLGFIGFDACFMATAEVAYQFRDLAKYMVASMYTEDSYGWPYDTIFGGLSGASDVKNITAGSFSSLVVQKFRDFHENNPNYWGDTQSAVDLSKLPDLKTKIDLFATAIYSESKQTNIETLRDGSINFYHNNETASVDVPYYDLYDFSRRIVEDTSEFSSGLRTAAQNVIDALASTVVSAYGGAGNVQQSYYFGDGSSVKRGLSLFFSRGNKTFTDDGNHPLMSASGAQSHFWFQWWYTSTNTSDIWPGNYLGKLDFCDSDLNGSVNTWRELMKAWYDPATNVNTPGAY